MNSQRRKLNIIYIARNSINVIEQTIKKGTETFFFHYTNRTKHPEKLQEKIDIFFKTKWKKIIWSANLNICNISEIYSITFLVIM